MHGSRDERGKKARLDYFKWTPEMEDELLRLLVEEVKNGNRQSNGTFKKWIIQQNVIPVLEAKFSCRFKYDNVYNKWKNWKRRLEPVETIMKNSSGFGWDPQSQKLTCSEETWQNIIQVKLANQHNYIYCNIFQLFL